MKEVINKGASDPNNAAYGNLKFVTHKYKQELSQKTSKDQVEKA